MNKLDQMNELDDVIGKLTAAALQISPKDDQIIADHIRNSVALLLQYRQKIRQKARTVDRKFNNAETKDRTAAQRMESGN